MYDVVWCNDEHFVLVKEQLKQRDQFSGSMRLFHSLLLNVLLFKKNSPARSFFLNAINCFNSKDYVLSIFTKVQNDFLRLLFLVLFLVSLSVPGIAYAAADLAITKSVSNAFPLEGDSIIYTLTLTNNGTQNASQLEITDILPTGVTYVSDDSGGSYNNTTGLWTPNPLQSGNSLTINITVTVDAGTTGSTITNTATITASSRTDPVSTNNTSSVDILVGVPNITVLKSSLVSSDPVNGSTNPKAIPGSTLLYNIQVTNSAAGTPDIDTVVISDPIPVNTAMVVTGTPVFFIDGVTSSALNFTFTSLASTTDDVEFSNDGGISWTYSPVADANGVDTNVTNVRINPKGTFAGSNGINNPGFTLRFQVIVQ